MSISYKEKQKSKPWWCVNVRNITIVNVFFKFVRSYVYVCFKTQIRNLLVKEEISKFIRVVHESFIT